MGIFEEVRQLAKKLVAIFASVVMVVGLAGGFLGALLATTTTPFASAALDPQNCIFSYNGVYAKSTTTYIAALPVGVNVSVNFACSNLNLGWGTGEGVSEGDIIGGTFICQGSDSSGCTAGKPPSGTDSTDAALGEGAINSPPAAEETCVFGCGSTWNSSFSTGNPWGDSGSISGLVSSAGDANASCPTSPDPTGNGATVGSGDLVVNMGIWACLAAAAASTGEIDGAVLLTYPTGSGVVLPANPTLAVSSASVSPSASVSLSDASGHTSYWWGWPFGQAPTNSNTLDGITLPAVPVAAYICPSSSGNLDPTPSSSCTVIQSSSDFGTGYPVQITAADYPLNTNSSSSTYGYPSGSVTSGMDCPGGNSGSGDICPFGPTPTPEKISGNITAPSTPGQYAVEVYEGNTIYTDVTNAMSNTNGGSNANGPAGNCSSAQATAVGVANCLTAYATLTVTSPAPTLSSISPTSGPASGGTTVTLTGTNFVTTSGGTTVSFGGTAATSVTCSTTSSCTAVSPSGTGTVSVTVTTSGGTSGAQSYTYIPAPTLSSISPTSGPASGGTTVTLTGTNFVTTSGGTTVSFGGTAATSVTCSTTSSCTAVSPSGTGTVSVTVTTSGGTSGAQSYTYIPAPTLSSISPTSGPASGGTTVTLTGTNFVTTSGGTTVSFGGTAATSVTCSTTSSCTAVSPSGTGTVSV
ncbi:MAG: IPT/TIG domain-containing protein, partial [Actinobacteria bacterium]|nr:IPT/TIG domain-containing protein [Actinomycetota bacterium]